MLERLLKSPQQLAQRPWSYGSSHSEERQRDALQCLLFMRCLEDGLPENNNGKGVSYCERVDTQKDTASSQEGSAAGEVMIVSVVG